MAPLRDWESPRLTPRLLSAALASPASTAVSTGGHLSGHQHQRFAADSGSQAHVHDPPRPPSRLRPCSVCYRVAVMVKYPSRPGRSYPPAHRHVGWLYHLRVHPRIAHRIHHKMSAGLLPASRDVTAATSRRRAPCICPQPAFAYSRDGIRGLKNRVRGFQPLGNVVQSPKTMASKAITPASITICPSLVTTPLNTGACVALAPVSGQRATNNCPSRDPIPLLNHWPRRRSHVLPQGKLHHGGRLRQSVT